MTETNQPNEPTADPHERAQLVSRLPISVGAATLILIAAAIVGMVFAGLSVRTAPETQTAAVEAIDPFVGISVEAKAAIVIDIQSGRTLYEKNADVQLPLASLTKVALMLVVAEVLPVDSIITIPFYAAGAGSSEHLSKGERWRVGDVIDFTLLTSSNNGAGILAGAANDAIHEHYPGSPGEGATLWRMNELVKSLGLERTFFLNVSGLDLSTTQAASYGSARDMAKLFAYAASAEPSLFAGTARDDVLLTSQGGHNTTSAFNTNDAQGAIPGLIMGKTGITDLAGGNLAVVFDIGLARPVVAVVLGSSEKGRFVDMQKLVSAARKAIVD